MVFYVVRQGSIILLRTVSKQVYDRFVAGLKNPWKLTFEIACKEG